VVSADHPPTRAPDQTPRAPCITADPPPEIATVGHNRCIIPLRPQSLSAWLTPDADLPTYYALLDDHERQYCAHELAA